MNFGKQVLIFSFLVTSCLFLLSPSSQALVPFAFWRATCEINTNWTPQWASVVGYWPLNGGVGAAIANNAAVDATVGTAGTNKNAGNTYAAGKTGTAGISFGGGTYITMGNPTSLNGTGLSQATLMAWVKLNVPDNQAQTLMGKELSYKFQVEDKTGDPANYPGGGSSVTLYISRNGSSWVCDSQTRTAILDNVWTHVAVTWDQTTNWKIYFNGVSQSVWTSCNLSSAGAPANSAYNFQLSGWNGTQEAYTGVLDEAVVFNKALTGAEILQIYDRQKGCLY